MQYMNECSNAVNTANSNQRTSRDQNGLFAEPSPGGQNELLRPGGQNESTPVQNELLSEESLLKTTQKKQTLNVEEEVSVFYRDVKSPSNRPTQSLPDRMAAQEAARIAEELRDWGSERRYQQLLAICERDGLSHLPKEALTATRNRLAKEGTRGVVGKPGAYFCRILVKLLQDHQVFVPVAGEDDPEEVRRSARASLGLDV